MEQIQGLLYMLFAAGFMFGPCVLAGLIGSLVSRPWKAFLVAWIASPLIGLAFGICFVGVLYAFILENRALMNPNFLTMAFKGMPLFCFLTGLPAGIAAAMYVSQRESLRSPPAPHSR